MKGSSARTTQPRRLKQRPPSAHPWSPTSWSLASMPGDAARRPVLLDPILDIVSALRKVSTKSAQAHRGNAREWPSPYQRGPYEARSYARVRVGCVRIDGGIERSGWCALRATPDL